MAHQSPLYLTLPHCHQFLIVHSSPLLPHSSSLHSTLSHSTSLPSTPFHLPPFPLTSFHSSPLVKVLQFRVSSEFCPENPFIDSPWATGHLLIPQASAQHLHQMPRSASPSNALLNISINRLCSTSLSNASIQHPQYPWHQTFLSKLLPFCVSVGHLSHPACPFGVFGLSVQPLHSTPMVSLRAHRWFVFLAPVMCLKAIRRDVNTNI